MINDGGPAFPNTHVHPERIGQFNDEDRIREGWYGQGGMSLRDYFAAKAMQGMNANSDVSLAMARAKLTPEEAREYIVSSAYKQADAMLKAREAKP